MTKAVSTPNCIPFEAGPSTGKSTLIDRLRKRGFNCLDEVGTQIIREGLTPDHGRKLFQDELLRRQLIAEKFVRESGQLWFLDRGLLCGRAHFIYDKLPIPDAYDELDVSHYAFVFIVEPLSSFEYNGIRPAWENLEFSMQMTDLIEDQYRRRNIATVRVPAMKAASQEQEIELRLEFILRHCRAVFPEEKSFRPTEQLTSSD